nr:uncharacterized protein LOC126519135 [Dermacentor andersoni]
MIASKPPIILTYNGTLNTSKTGSHLRANALTYKFCEGCAVTLHKVMYLDTKGGCIILVQDIGDGKKGCQLLRTELTIETEVPKECYKVYKENCKGDVLKMYEKKCKHYNQVLIPRTL